MESTSPSPGYYPFNVRVYGICINAQQQVLVSDEYIKGGFYTKFPGGGLEYGEGTRDCLKREWAEELFQEAEIGEHLYTTDFFQESAFGDGRQIISVYYRVKPVSPFVLPFKEKPFDFDELRDQAEVFRWINREDFSAHSVTLPIDKVVAEIIKDMEFEI
ncbi:NUDIX domain-containing protein [Compostibacter hankyongensis]|uniref:Nudix hydrolase domain-containing protein n=1 Tax=Compostibacter hankyongensis TaxID=1007089 RepID=A0ABP8G5W9_9BACT